MGDGTERDRESEGFKVREHKKRVAIWLAGAINSLARAMEHAVELDKLTGADERAGKVEFVHEIDRLDTIARTTMARLGCKVSERSTMEVEL